MTAYAAFFHSGRETALPPMADRYGSQGPVAVHIGRSLRMREGETLFLCDGEGTDYFCELAGFEGEGVLFRVLYHTPTALEPDTAVTLYQGLPKGEKMDWILQKAVELGAGEIVPVVTARSIVRLKPGEGEKKRERWQRIAAEAAGQCGRGRIPLVSQPLPFAEAAARLAGEPALVFYEGGGRPLGELVGRDCRRLSIVVGPEGGFEKEEVTRLLRNGRSRHPRQTHPALRDGSSGRPVGHHASDGKS